MAAVRRDPLGRRISRPAKRTLKTDSRASPLSISRAPLLIPSTEELDALWTLSEGILGQLQSFTVHQDATVETSMLRARLRTSLADESTESTSAAAAAGIAIQEQRFLTAYIEELSGAWRLSELLTRLYHRWKAEEEDVVPELFVAVQRVRSFVSSEAISWRTWPLVRQLMLLEPPSHHITINNKSSPATVVGTVKAARMIREESADLYVALLDSSRKRYFSFREAGLITPTMRFAKSAIGDVVYRNNKQQSLHEDIEKRFRVDFQQLSHLGQYRSLMRRMKPLHSLKCLETLRLAEETRKRQCIRAAGRHCATQVQTFIRFNDTSVSCEDLLLMITTFRCFKAFFGRWRRRAHRVQNLRGASTALARTNQRRMMRRHFQCWLTRGIQRLAEMNDTEPSACAAATTASVACQAEVGIKRRRPILML